MLRELQLFFYFVSGVLIGLLPAIRVVCIVCAVRVFGFFFSSTFIAFVHAFVYAKL